jgi:NAD(P)-dependent dehydrogenase (short-subunit alcohol dehydrogenase family)
MATGLRACGYRVIATARAPVDVARLRREGLESVQLDYADSASVQQCVADVVAVTGNQLYGLVNNGGYGQPGAVEDLSRDVLRAQFEVNLFGWHDLTMRVLPLLRQQGHGRVINIGSVAAFFALAFRGSYAATKHALEALSWALRLELRGSNVFVSLIEPGPLHTSMRAYGLEMFRRNIDRGRSPHRASYEQLEARLFTPSPVYPGTRDPAMLLQPLRHALESRRPRARYFLSASDRALVLLAQCLPERLLERLLWRLSQVGGLDARRTT